jgi:hypothetical protein
MVEDEPSADAEGEVVDVKHGRVLASAALQRKTGLLDRDDGGL